MPGFGCEKCGKTFAKRAWLDRHRARKTPCDSILEPENLPEAVRNDPQLEKKKCRFCGRVFSSYDVMRRHVRNFCRIAPNQRNGEEGVIILYEHTLRKQQAQIDQLMTLVRQSPPAEVSIQAADHAQVAVDNRKFVTINVFGQEDLSHLTPAKIKAILDEALKKPNLHAAILDALLRAGLLIYSDSGRPENATCLLLNKKTDTALVHSADGWAVQPAKILLGPMATKSADIIFDLQPFEDPVPYGPILSELRDRESEYTAEADMRAILIRNKDLARQIHGAVPAARGAKQRPAD